jgi:hypothetical protein
MDWSSIFVASLPVISAVLVAVLNNWEKINPSKRRVNEMYKLVSDLKSELQANSHQFDELSKQVKSVSSAQRISLQTRILEYCKKIQNSIDAGEIDYREDLKQLILLYREYYLCGYNSQGRLYFNDTIQKAADDNNTLVHELMTTYFSDYDPDAHI